MMARLQLFLAVFVALCCRAEGCSCYARHPQEIFCSKSTDFVVKAVVVSGKHIYRQNISLTEKRFSGLAYYNTYITKVYRGHDALKKTFFPKNNSETFNPRRQKVIMYTSASSGTCGVYLQPGTKYLLSGTISNSKLKVGTCDLVVPFHELSRQQRAGIRGAYDCRCSLKRCPIGQFCDIPAGSCEWGGHSLGKEIKCDMKHRACKKIGNECLWLEDQKYERCITQHYS